MSKLSNGSPWVSKAHLEVAVARVVAAEAALKQLLDYIDPEILIRHDFDYLAAVDELINGGA